MPAVSKPVVPVMYAAAVEGLLRIVMQDHAARQRLPEIRMTRAFEGAREFQIRDGVECRAGRTEDRSVNGYDQKTIRDHDLRAVGDAIKDSDE